MPVVKKWTKENAGHVLSMSVNMLNTALKPWGLSVVRGNATFNEFDLEVKIKFRVLSSESSESSEGSRMPAGFPGLAARLGLPTDCWGKSFRFGGEVYKVLDIKPRNRKYPLIAVDSHGVRKKLAPHMAIGNFV
jgi:hypothetical protein